MWQLSCYSSYKPGDESWVRKGQGSAYDKWNISVVICYTNILCNVLWIVVWSFALILLAIVLSIIRFTDSDYPFCIFKLFFIYYLRIEVLKFASFVKCSWCVYVYSVRQFYFVLHISISPVDVCSVLCWVWLVGLRLCRLLKLKKEN